MTVTESAALAEIVALNVPIFYDGAVLGTIDVESEHVDGFDPLDTAFVERCAAAARPLWRRT